MTWSRSDDQLIAERCEGKRTTIIYPDGAVIVDDDGTFSPLPHYNLDPAACLRAAEAWRLQKPGRAWEVHSAAERRAFGNHPASATVWRNVFPFSSIHREGQDALLWALREAVKDE